MWMVHGSEENWRQAFAAKGIWGFEDTPLDKVYWLALAPNDVILFYITGKVKGIVGYGLVRNKFYQNVPLWKAEIQEGCVKWPLRFEFDVMFLLPEDKWTEEKIPVPRGGGFRQPMVMKNREEIEGIIRTINPHDSMELLGEFSTISQPEQTEVSSPTHKNIQKFLQEIGKLQNYIANSEFAMGTERLDVVWRRLPESVPTYVFEVQVGGDIYHALGKLKHAYDLWNSRIFLVASMDDWATVNQLLSGTYHEIKSIVRFINIDKIINLHTVKQNAYQIEKELGILP